MNDPNGMFMGPDGALHAFYQVSLPMQQCLQVCCSRAQWCLPGKLNVPS